MTDKQIPLVAIVMGSDSDLPVMQQAADVLEELGLAYKMSILSAHRTPKAMMEFAENASSRGFRVIVAGAGGAAHLPGMVAAGTELPVVGVPINATPLNGLDALMSVAQMPGGVPVATVAINGAKNAGILAAQILGAGDAGIRNKVLEHKKRMEMADQEKAQKLASKQG